MGLVFYKNYCNNNLDNNYRRYYSWKYLVIKISNTKFILIIEGEKIYKSLVFNLKIKKMVRFNKKAAIELSIGTIVILVIAMSMLILGLVLVKNIFSGATDVTSMSLDQVKNHVSKMFGEDSQLVVYPDSRQINAKIGTAPSGSFAIGIKNTIESVSNVNFSYQVVPTETTNCGVTTDQASGWLTTGGSDQDIPIAPGGTYVTKVLLTIPPGTQLCTLRYRINVQDNGQTYATDNIDVTTTG